jgi:hypothetical protein
MQEIEILIMFMTSDRKLARKPQLICPKCARILPSSKKEMLEGGKHLHKEWKSGDTII